MKNKIKDIERRMDELTGKDCWEDDIDENNSTLTTGKNEEIFKVNENGVVYAKTEDVIFIGRKIIDVKLKKE